MTSTGAVSTGGTPGFEETYELQHILSDLSNDLAETYVDVNRTSP